MNLFKSFFLFLCLTSFLLIQGNGLWATETPVKTLTKKPAQVTQNFFLPDYKEPQLVEPSVPSTGLDVIGFGIKLLIVIGIIYISLALLKNFMRSRGKIKSSASMIQVLDSHFFSPKQSIQLINIAGELLLIGVTEQGMSRLETFSDPEIKNRIIEKADSEPVFNHYLKSFMKKDSGELMKPTVAQAEEALERDTFNEDEDPA